MSRGRGGRGGAHGDDAVLGDPGGQALGWQRLELGRPLRVGYLESLIGPLDDRARDFAAQVLDVADLEVAQIGQDLRDDGRLQIRQDLAVKEDRHDGIHLDHHFPIGSPIERCADDQGHEAEPPAVAGGHREELHAEAVLVRDQDALGHTFGFDHFLDPRQCVEDDTIDRVQVDEAADGRPGLLVVVVAVHEMAGEVDLEANAIDGRIPLFARNDPVSPLGRISERRRILLPPARNRDGALEEALFRRAAEFFLQARDHLVEVVVLAGQDTGFAQDRRPVHAEGIEAGDRDCLVERGIVRRKRPCSPHASEASVELVLVDAGDLAGADKARNPEADPLDHPPETFPELRRDRGFHLEARSPDELDLAGAHEAGTDAARQIRESLAGKVRGEHGLRRHRRSSGHAGRAAELREAPEARTLGLAFRLPAGIPLRAQRRRCGRTLDVLDVRAVRAGVAVTAGGRHGSRVLESRTLERIVPGVLRGSGACGHVLLEQILLGRQAVVGDVPAVRVTVHVLDAKATLSHPIPPETAQKYRLHDLPSTAGENSASSDRNGGTTPKKGMSMPNEASARALFQPSSTAGGYWRPSRSIERAREATEREFMAFSSLSWYSLARKDIRAAWGMTWKRYCSRLGPLPWMYSRSSACLRRSWRVSDGRSCQS